MRRAFLASCGLALASVCLLLGKTENPEQRTIENSQIRAAIKADREDGVRFVSPSGSDSNDGLSWGSAMATVYTALTSLPGGRRTPPTSGSGTVYVADGAKANPIPGAGVWLMAPKDPNYQNPPPGWLRSNGAALRIEGVGKGNYGPNGHRVRAKLEAGGNGDTKHPGIWLSQTQSPIEFLNLAIAYPGRPIVIGECSNQLRGGRCGVSSVTLENLSTSPMTVAGMGPSIDITGGSFWLFLRDISAGGNAYHASGGRMTNAAAAILIDGNGNSGNGLIQMRDMNLAGGGVKFIPGTNGGSLYIENLTEEGDFVQSIPPAVWFTDYSGFVDAAVSNIQIADEGPTAAPAVLNEGSGPGPLVAGTVGVIEGPAVVLSQYNNTLRNQAISPLLQNQSGFFNGYLVGESDLARRLGTMVAVRFENRANTDPRTWTATNFSGKVSVSPGKADPFGGNQAGEASATTAAQEALYLTGACSASEFTPLPGDWIVGGVWVKSSAGGYSGSPTNAIALTYCGNPTPVYSFSTSRGGQIRGDGQWQWHWIASKITSGKKTTVSLSAYFSREQPLVAYGPVLYFIPQGTASDNEVLEFANTAAPVDSACPAGTVCNVAGHPLVASSFGILRKCVAKTSPATCGSAAAGSFAISPNSVSTTVQTSAVTANGLIFVNQDSSLAATLGVRCNTKAGVSLRVSDRVAGSSFSVTTSSVSTDDPICISYHILN